MVWKSPHAAMSTGAPGKIVRTYVSSIVTVKHYIYIAYLRSHFVSKVIANTNRKFMKLIGKFHRFQKATAELFFDVPNSNTHAHEPPALELEPI